jgi:pteridine reductase
VKHKTALITGSGRKRVGYVIAKHLAQLGHNIAIHYHSSAESAEENVNELAGLGIRCKAFQADVTEESDVRRLIEDVTDHFQTIDILVTTSSIWKTIPLDELNAEAVLASFRVNTLGTFLCCQHGGLQMTTQQDGGVIVTIGDSLSQHPYVDHAAYFTAKGAIPTLTRSFAVELGSRNRNVRVNCIAPGPVMFPEDMPEQKRQQALQSTLLHRANCPETVAQTVEFFVNNPMLTGECIDLDGGRNIAFEHKARSRTDVQNVEDSARVAAQERQE